MVWKAALPLLSRICAPGWVNMIAIQSQISASDCFHDQTEPHWPGLVVACLSDELVQRRGGASARRLEQLGVVEQMLRAVEQRMP